MLAIKYTKLSTNSGGGQPRPAITYELIEMAEGRWNKLTGTHFVVLIRTGAECRN